MIKAKGLDQILIYIFVFGSQRESMSELHHMNSTATLVTQVAPWSDFLLWNYFDGDRVMGSHYLALADF